MGQAPWGPPFKTHPKGTSMARTKDGRLATPGRGGSPLSLGGRPGRGRFPSKPVSHHGRCNLMVNPLTRNGRNSREVSRLTANGLVGFVGFALVLWAVRPSCNSARAWRADRPKWKPVHGCVRVGRHVKPIPGCARVGLGEPTNALHAGRPR